MRSWLYCGLHAFGWEVFGGLSRAKKERCTEGCGGIALQGTGILCLLTWGCQMPQNALERMVFACFCCFKESFSTEK